MMSPSKRFSRCCAAIALIGSIAATVPAAAQQQILLRNGDRLSGRLKAINDSSWLVSFLGRDLAVSVDSIAGLRAPEPVGLRLADGSVLAATIEPVADSLALRLADGSVRLVQPRDLVAVGAATDLRALRARPYGLLTGLLTRWVFTGSLGFTDKRGNSRGRAITAGFQLLRKTKRDRINLGATAINEQSEAPNGELETTVAKGSQFLQTDLYISQRVFLTAATRQDQDRFQDIDLRSTYTAGIGVQLANSPSTDLRLNLSGGVRREVFVSGGTTVNSVAGLGTSWRQTLGRVVLDWRVEWDPRLTAISDYRFVSNASLTAKVYKGFGLRIAVLEEYNSRPPVGVSKNDVLTTTTLTYAIGR